MVIVSATEFREVPSLLKKGIDIVLFERSIEWSKHEFTERTDIYTRKRKIAELIAQKLGSNKRVKAKDTIPYGYERMAKKFNRVICFHSNHSEDVTKDLIEAA